MKYCIIYVVMIALLSACGLSEREKWVANKRTPSNAKTAELLEKSSERIRTDTPAEPQTATTAPIAVSRMFNVLHDGHLLIICDTGVMHHPDCPKCVKK